MKTHDLLKIALSFFLLAAIGVAVYLYFEKINGERTEILNTAEAPKENLAKPPEFNPASLNWQEAASSAPWEGRDSQAVVVYKGKIWLMGGLDANGHVVSPGNVDYGNASYFSDIWSSEDGINWQLVSEKAPWGDRRSIQVVSFKGKMWLMGGWGPEVDYKNDVWSSEDGVSWKLETSSANWPAREGHQLLVFQDKIWLIGGVRYDKHLLFTDVWFSADGINWTKATENAGWAPRWDFASAVFDNKLWTISGMDLAGNVYKDVWFSKDGINWQRNSDPPFETRQGGAIVDYKNELWVVSRLNIPAYGGGINDVWYSSDGINWKKTEEDPLWTGREDVCVVVFKDKIWVLGGMDENWEWKNDVWYSTSNIDPAN